MLLNIKIANEVRNMQPIYNQTQNSELATKRFIKNKQVGHAGLWFDKFYIYKIFDDDGNLELNETSYKTKRIKEKSEFLSQFKRQSGTCGDSETLKDYAIRQRLLCEAQGGIAKIYKNNWLMAIGLGNKHPLENGLLWHPTLGVPYFQGSTVKGMVKALMEAWGADPQLINRWFGSINLLTSPNQTGDKLPPTYKHTFGESLDLATKKKLNEQNTGVFIFLDAVPVKFVTLKTSIITPHYGEWYQNGDKDDTQPGDWYSPMPIDFLTVEDASMQFAVIPRLEADIQSYEMEQVSNVIALALEYMGIGAKTATGYGRMQVDKATDVSYKEKMQLRLHNLKIATLSEEEQVIHKFESHLDDLPTAWRGKKNINCGFNDFYNTIIKWDNITMLEKAYEVLITRGQEWQGQALKKNKRWKDKFKELEEKLTDNQSTK